MTRLPQTQALAHIGNRLLNDDENWRAAQYTFHCQLNDKHTVQLAIPQAINYMHRRQLHCCGRPMVWGPQEQGSER